MLYNYFESFISPSPRKKKKITLNFPINDLEGLFSIFKAFLQKICLEISSFLETTLNSKILKINFWLKNS